MFRLISAVAAVEGIYQITTRNLISLSEQELVDCNVDSRGCSGGSMDTAFQFIQQNNGLTSEDNYPYIAQDNTCDSTKTATSVVQITGYEDVPPSNEQALLQAVANQPVSVSIEGSGPNFQHYSSGVFAGPCGTHLDHAVTIIGYGTTTDGTNYWLVKNSWGSSWGENGYMKIDRDAVAEGRCGIKRHSGPCLWLVLIASVNISYTVTVKPAFTVPNRYSHCIQMQLKFTNPETLVSRNLRSMQRGLKKQNPGQWKQQYSEEESLQAQMEACDIAQSPNLDSRSFDKLHISEGAIVGTAPDNSREEKADSIPHSGKNLTLETLFGSAFMKELQSAEALVSIQRGSVGSAGIDISEQ
ncbi:senescence-specific cysteine protease SAG12-like [Camellia sinensis]|uniref:senescence-specific cysteine protease SAG12-like n=1 Tax=Camellia sinensis TaxID=4442 RepID=UPI00103617E6|nr:senescence-specific cysteine protease SAG12-like [Camellia sinensis]